MAFSERGLVFATGFFIGRACLMKVRSHSANILLVEDNPADARLVRDGLKEAKSSANLTVATHGEAALEFLQKQVGSSGLPQLIVLDLNLPGRNGTEILTDIKRNEALRHIPVIIFTSSSSDQDVDRAYACGANIYLRKPSNLDDFFALIQSMCDLWLGFAVLPSRSRPMQC
ncbi:MAG TPA: response regulator [Bryobacteraceae bacterium]|nr:response regulator [Bryobacteraceae bacterium]